MSKIIIIGGAAAATLVVMFLFYRHLIKGNTKTQAELKYPGLSPQEAAQLEFEDLVKNFFRQMVSIRIEFKNATSAAELQSIQERAESIRIDGNLELNNAQRIVHEDFGIVMIPAAEVDPESMSLEDVDNLVFSWTSCAPDGVIRECQTDARRERGDFD